MNKYEGLIIVKPDLSEEDRKNLFLQIDEAVTKHHGVISQGGLWAEKKKLFFPIKKYLEGVYYLLNFSVDPLAIKDIRHAYTLNENILRVLITKVE
ncbi:MAG: 30S ribosomal protein S6 [Candidatus Omnitrophota bacterium]|nr:30S ribosomal protein S6 [Candidatus Omnitrophota bacterium]